MRISEAERHDRLLWRFAIIDDVPDYFESPGRRFDLPGSWVDAVVAVTRDLRCLRHGRDVQPDRLMWGLSIGAEYAVTIGWSGDRRRERIQRVQRTVGRSPVRRSCGVS